MFKLMLIYIMLFLQPNSKEKADLYFETIRRGWAFNVGSMQIGQNALRKLNANAKYGERKTLDSIRNDLTENT